MKNQKKNLLYGAGILGIGAFFVKLIGAIYRIPLTNILKSNGIGLYQMVFPVYALLLDFSGAGVPSALSKLIAETGENKNYYAKKYLSISLKFFGALGLILSALISLFSGRLSVLQGNQDAKFAYLALSPAIFLVCLISCYRGVFQGYNDMKPTAISQIIEQVVKVGFGLFFASAKKDNLPIAVAGATLAITISEVCALIYLTLKYKKSVNRSSNNLISIDAQNKEITLKRILKAVIPITLVCIITPFSQVIDSFLIVNILKGTKDATSLYGIYSGVALTVINLPISVCHGLAVTTVVGVSSSKTEQEKTQKSNYLLTTTFVLSLIAGVFVLLFSKSIVGILFSSLSERDRALSNSLIKGLAVVIVLLSLVQTQNSIFIARGKYYVPLVTMLISVVIKSLIEIILLKNERLNIFGSAIALITCYFIAFLLNFILSKSVGEKNANKEHKTSKLRCAK